ncbi:MAG: T9SS type A sorting domain-containing protein [Ignavibacteria bacterium]|jgi:hypothetical protein
MTKKILLTCFFSFMVALTFAQEVTVTPYGSSNRDVALDSNDIFDRVYDGLQNVGVGTKIYLNGYSDAGDAANGTWLISSQPDGSSAEFGETYDLDTNSQIISIVLDVVGQYQFEFSNGTNYASITFNAGTYLGYDSGSLNCNTCHSETATNWLETKHATTLERGLNGTLSNHFQDFCVRCHSTGYDSDANSDGFDDRDFVFPDTTSQTTYEEVLVNSPEAMKLANVQCEACHGPGSEHIGNTNDSRIVNSFDTKLCSKCHDSGTHHVFPAQFDVSNHADLDRNSTSASCAQCHNGAGFVNYVKGGKVTLTEDEPAEVNIVCAACHDPHNATNDHQLRTVEATLETGEEVTVGGLGKLCMNCHRTRRDAVDYTTNYLDNLSSHYGPHHGNQAEVLLATNYPDLGVTFESTMHYNYTTDACVSCHMNDQGTVDENDNVLLSGGHSFRMSTPDGEDNVAACEPCHSFESFEAVTAEIDGVTDFDGDGTDEDLQHEVEGMLHKIEMMLPPLDSEEINTIDSTWTPLQAKAFYIWEMIEEDGSYGIHNAEFAVGILTETISQLEGATDVEEIEGLPATYALEQNYPNPFNPSTTIRFSTPEATNVKIVVFDALGREVTTLVNEELNPGNYNVDFDAANYSSGIYLYRIETSNFVQVKKMILLK